jgi:hypothetical protein
MECYLDSKDKGNRIQIYQLANVPEKVKDKILVNSGIVTRLPYKNKNGKYKINILCVNGHTLKTTLIKSLEDNDEWCTDCNQITDTIEDLHKHAAMLEGKCLSNDFINGRTQYKWQCGKCDHVWDSMWYSIKSKKSWCPNCKNSTREIIVLETANEVFSCVFKKDQDIIGMELDCYNDNLRIAIECDGLQHRIHVPHFQATLEDFQNQQKRDQQKNILCINNNIKLIRIPDRGIISTNKLREKTQKILIENAIKLNVPYSQDFMSCEDFNHKVAKTRIGKSNDHIKLANKIITNRGGELYSKHCISRSQYLSAKCENGHAFKPTIDGLTRKPKMRWCIYCTAQSPVTLNNLTITCLKKGYNYISTQDKEPNPGSRKRKYITFKCDVGHIAEMMWDNFKGDDKICSVCRKELQKQQTISRQLARARDKLHSSRRYIILDELAQIGYMAPDYEKVTDYNKITCVRHKHTFMAKIQAILKQPTKEFCTQCILIDDFPNLTLSTEFNYLDPALNSNKPCGKISLQCVCGFACIRSHTSMRNSTIICKNKQCKYSDKIYARNSNKSTNQPKIINKEDIKIKNQLIAKPIEIKTGGGSKIEKIPIRSLNNDYIRDPKSTNICKPAIYTCKKHNHQFTCRPNNLLLTKNLHLEYCTQCILKDDFPNLTITNDFDFLNLKMDSITKPKPPKIHLKCICGEEFQRTNASFRTMTKGCNRRPDGKNKCKFSKDKLLHRKKDKNVNIPRDSNYLNID